MSARTRTNPEKMMENEIVCQAAGMVVRRAELSASQDPVADKAEIWFAAPVC